MPTFLVKTPHCTYPNVVERGISRRILEFIPAKAGKLFLVTNEEIWQHYGEGIHSQFGDHNLTVLFLPSGEVNKRLSRVEELAEQMVAHGAERTSLVIGFGGGIVTDVSGFLAAIFMRGVPVIQAAKPE